jgi:hypothetical protein
LFLSGSKIKSLGNLVSVGLDLDLSNTKITSFGKLNYVGRDLNLYDTKLGDNYSREEIREMIDVKGDIYK